MSFGWRIATVVPEPRILVSLTIVLFACACTANQEKQASLPPVSETVEQLPEPKPAEAPVAAPIPPTFVVIEDSEAEAETARPQTLAEAAEAERARRATAPKPILALNNQSLAAHGKDQKLTVTGGSPGTEAAGARRDDNQESVEGESEAYWRERGLEIRQRWRAAHDRVAQLEGEAAALRHQFYGADDPYVRDSQIKPAWDRALDDLDQSRRDADRGAREVERFLEEGREAGALPGWLREGADLEPILQPLRAPSAEPTEPVEAREPPRDPA